VGPSLTRSAAVSAEPREIVKTPCSDLWIPWIPWSLDMIPMPVVGPNDRIKCNADAHRAHLLWHCSHDFDLLRAWYPRLLHGWERWRSDICWSLVWFGPSRWPWGTTSAMWVASVTMWWRYVTFQALAEDFPCPRGWLNMADPQPVCKFICSLLGNRGGMSSNFSLWRCRVLAWALLFNQLACQFYSGRLSFMAWCSTHRRMVSAAKVIPFLCQEIDMMPGPLLVHCMSDSLEPSG
jgi:hypothetical protein